MSRPPFAAALGEDPRGLRLELFVSPGASTASFPDRYDPWRRRIGIRVQAVARAGGANREVVRLVARFFELNEQEVSITRGAGTPLKTVVVEGVALEQATKRLAGDLG